MKTRYIAGSQQMLRADSESVAPLAIRYLNRLSDLLFVAARAINVTAGAAEPMWRPAGKGPAR